MDLSNKKVIVIGAGISGFAAAKLAKKLGADVILSDANEKLGEKHDHELHNLHTYQNLHMLVIIILLVEL